MRLDSGNVRDQYRDQIFDVSSKFYSATWSTAKRVTGTSEHLSHGDFPLSSRRSIACLVEAAAQCQSQLATFGDRE